MAGGVATQQSDPGNALVTRFVLQKLLAKCTDPHLPLPHLLPPHEKSPEADRSTSEQSVQLTNKEGEVKD